MRLVVTGALGHIGSRLVRFLPEAFPGCEVTMVDNLSTQRFGSLFDLPRTGRYRFVEADVTKVDLVPLLRGADAVVQLAAITDAAGSFDRAREVENNNFHATRRIAETCAELGIALIAPSSTSVYGTQKTVVDEDCGVEDLKPQSPYAETKLKEEDLLGTLFQSGLKVVRLRLGTIFGTSPGMRFHTAVNKFCWQAVFGVPLTVCPLSNVRLGVAASLEAHPLRARLAAGLNVSVPSDDPPYFGGYITDNLLACQAA